MDTLFQDFSNSIYNFGCNHGSLPSSNPDSPPESADSGSNGSEFDLGSAPVPVPFYQFRNLNPLPPFPSSYSESPSVPEYLDPSTLGLNQDEDDGTDQVLNYINEMLMEEEMGEKTCMLQDSLALQAAEKSFYNALVDDKYPPSSEQCPPCVCQNAEENPNDTISLVNSLARASLVSDSGSNSFSNISEWCFTQESNNLSRSEGGRKSYKRDDRDCLEEGMMRSNKQFAISLADVEKSENFDDVFLFLGNPLSLQPPFPKKGKKSRKKVEVVDLWSLLIQCAQAVSIIDHRSYTALLKQIRQHASESGDGLQRLAHYFACGLEIRLAGMGVPAYSPMLSNRTSAADILRAYRTYVTASPFTKMSNFYANRMILEAAEGSTTLHIIDFGICYGLQWPCLIQRLSERPGGPPKLRITGIELPQPGFRPAERVEETGERLRKFCERFNVPFEYNVLAKKWETIQLEELNLGKDEVIAVNCIYRFRHLPDDTTIPNSARNTVLKLVKDMKPVLFVHGVLNGTYSPPFFVTRFKEALFHYSALFDMFDATVRREDQQRMMFEREVFGRDILNVIACDGVERVERPETYKQWQGRNQRAGLKQIGLNQELLKVVTTMVDTCYNKDFDVDVDGNWMLQGWKGRVLYALSCWKPVN